MLHIFVGCWKSARDSLQNMRETMNTCDMSFTLSDNNKVTIQFKCILLYMVYLRDRYKSWGLYNNPTESITASFGW